MTRSSAVIPYVLTPPNDLKVRDRVLAPLALVHRTDRDQRVVRSVRRPLGVHPSGQNHLGNLIPRPRCFRTAGIQIPVCGGPTSRVLVCGDKVLPGSIPKDPVLWGRRLALGRSDEASIAVARATSRGILLRWAKQRSRQSQGAPRRNSLRHRSRCGVNRFSRPPVRSTQNRSGRALRPAPAADPRIAVVARRSDRAGPDRGEDQDRVVVAAARVAARVKNRSPA